MPRAPWGTDQQRNSRAEFAVSEALTGQTVGLIGGGYVARRLIELLRPFQVRVLVHDPYLAADVAYAYGFTLTSLDNVLSLPKVVVCLAPLTPRTRGMLGARELGTLPPGSVFVNVSRGGSSPTR